MAECSLCEVHTDQTVPATAEEYLRMVRRQARQIPDVVLAPKPRDSHVTGHKEVASEDASGRKSCRYMDVEECSESLLPSVEWESHYLQARLEDEFLIALVEARAVGCISRPVRQ